MGTNVIFFGWNQPSRGSDQAAQALFGEFHAVPRRAAAGGHDPVV
jgi:hypothetical protein